MTKRAKVYLGGGNGGEQNDERAEKKKKKAAQCGDAKGMFYAGILYMEGFLIEQNYEKAMFWFEKAALKKYEDAIYMLGKIYRDGKCGVKKDLKKAIEMFEKAAQEGSRAAVTCLGKAYLYGDGVEKDYMKAVNYFLENSWVCNKIKECDEAFEWFLKEAQSGNDEAAIALGCIYAGYGHDRYQDCSEIGNSKALYWFRKLADKGNDAAMFRLGKWYEDNCYTFSDKFSVKGHPAAKFWYKKAAKLGNKYAANALDTLRGFGGFE
jgi:TPR repeat protein